MFKLPASCIPGTNSFSIVIVYNCRYGDENNDDDYLSVLNSIWEKYQGEDDPEDLSETDMEEILDYLSGKVGY